MELSRQLCSCSRTSPNSMETISWVRPIQSIPPRPTSPNQSQHYPPTYVLDFLEVSFFPVFLPIIYTHSSSPTRSTTPAHLIPLDEIITWRRVQTPHIRVFSNLSSLHLSSVQIFSLETCSNTLTLPSLLSETKFPTHIEPQAKL
jgi:hypothetical protein